MHTHHIITSKKVSYWHLWGVFRIKCAGQNNFNTNHFRNSLFQDFFRPNQSRFGLTVCSGLSTTKRQRWTCFCCWCRRPPSSLSWGCPGQQEVKQLRLSSLKQKKVRCGGILGTGRLVDHLDAFAAITVLEWVTGRVWVFIISQKPALGLQQGGLFSLKIIWDVSSAFLVEAVLTV